MKKHKLKVFSKTKFIEDLKKAERKLILEADRECFKKVLERDNYKCAICGKGRDSKQTLHPMHIYPREYAKLRWNINNLLIGCARCHIYAQYSFHQNPLFFVEWLKIHRLEQYEYLMSFLKEFTNDCNIKNYFK
jgi:hypothetical protein